MASKNVHVFTEENFNTEVLASTVPVVVDFTATWCGPCRALAPVIDQLADKFEGQVKVGKVDIDASPGVTSRYGIRSVPTVLVFQGGEKKAQSVGLVSLEKLSQLVGV